MESSGADDVFFSTAILDIDLKRKEELKEIKKQIRKADEWAERRRRSVIEELRRVCTPVNGHSDHQGSSSHSRSISRGRQPSEMENMKAVDHSRAGHDANIGHQNRHFNPLESVGYKTYKAALKTASLPKRSASTPPELNQSHRHAPINASAGKQGLVYSEAGLSGDEHQQDVVMKERALCSSSVRPDHHQYSSYPPRSPPPRPSVQLKRNPAPYHHHYLFHPSTINPDLVNELDKLGPAGFAINGFVSLSLFLCI